MYAQKVKLLLAVLAAMVLVIGTGVAYATNSGAQDTGTGNHGAQVAGDDDAEEPGDADEPGDVDGPGDTEDDD